MTDTIFGKIARGEMECDKVHEDDRCVAFRDINPQAPTHILIIPKASMETVREIDKDPGIMDHMVAVANEIADKEGISEKGYRLVVNMGPAGGQSVYHLHLHLLGGRALTWPPG